jgi:hypothetical protein
MKTELEIKDHVINPGSKIQVHSFPTRNYLLHQVCEPISQLMLGLIESDSGNSVAQNSARETRNVWKGWELVKLEWKQAKEFRDAPKPIHEQQYDILVPTVNEVLTIQNVKVKRIVQQLRHLVMVLLGLDAASMQTWLSDFESGEVEILLAQAEKVILTYFGTGAVDKGAFNTGVEAPRYSYGQLIPDVDRNAGSMWEPSSSAPEAPVPDVADTPSIAPAPGDKQK